MAKAITSSIVVLLIAGSAFGQIGNIGAQQQSWYVDNGATVGLLGGQGNASNTQNFGTLVIQGASSTEGTTAYQGMGALIGQSSNVTTVGAPVSVQQEATINGDALTTPTGIVVPLGQTQSFEAYAGAARQYEGVDVGATQTLTKEDGGTSTATGDNTVLTGQAQIGGNGCLTMGQGFLIGGDQSSVLNGTTCASAGTVTTNMGMTVVQSQTANCPLTICPLVP